MIKIQDTIIQTDTQSVLDTLKFDLAQHSNYGTIKQRLSKSLSGENNGMYGKSPANKGVAMSDEQKEKLRLSHLGNNKGRHWKLIDGKRVWYD